MKQSVVSHTGNTKPRASSEMALDASAGMKREKRVEVSTSAPQWTRYIDSRLKQFCSR